MENEPSTRPDIGHSVADKIAAGAYTDIIEIYGPAEAGFGDTVNLRIDVKNLHSTGIYISTSGHYDGTDFFPLPDVAEVAAYATKSFNHSFSMPNKDIRIDVWTFYWTGTEWYEDDHMVVYIDLETLEPEFKSFGVTDYSER